MKCETIEFLCPECESHWHYRYADLPIPARVQCDSCREYVSVIELYCAGRAKKSTEEIEDLNTIEDLIKYNEGRLQDTNNTDGRTRRQEGADEDILP